MSTGTWERNGNLIDVIVVGFCLVLLLIGLAVSVLVNSHAVIKHGDNAIAIRSCLDTKGEYQIWKSITDPNKFFRICELEPGNFGFQIVQCLATGVCEKTAFIKGNGTWGELMKYLGKIATRFNGAIP